VFNNKSIRVEKTILPLFLLTIWSITGYAQNCTVPVSSAVFQQKINQLAPLRNDQQRLLRATEFAENNCLLTYQIKQMAELFNDDLTRLSFVENAYPSTFDKDNFYDVYDVFAYFSTVMRLHDYLLEYNKQGKRQAQHRPGTEPDFRFPEYNYPSYKTYRETTRCDEPLSNEAFYRMLRSIMKQPDDELRIALAVQLAEGNCLTVEQIMKMGSLIEKEQKRLDYLKRTYHYSYDIGNFQFSDQLLTSNVYHEDFKNYLHAQNKDYHRDRSPEPNRSRHCHVPDADLADMIASIKNQSFNNTQLTLAKQIVKSKQCFTTLQIKQIIDIFSYEDSKLEMAQYCYDYCIDRDNYYKINDSFSYSSSVTKLVEFISSRQH
jgi:hypothetical protein